MHTCTCSGGIELTFIGTNLDVVQNPVLVVSDMDYLDAANVSHVYIHLAKLLVDRKICCAFSRVQAVQ